LAFKKAVYVGEGANVFYMVHISFRAPFTRAHVIYLFIC